MANYMFEFLDDTLMGNREHYFTNKEIIELCMGRPLANDARHFESVKSTPYWNSLDAAFRNIRSILRKDYGADFDFKNGHNATGGYRYPKELEDPIRPYRTKHRQVRTQRLVKLLHQSVGLLPQTWMADVISGAQRLSSDDGKLISFDRNMLVKNLQWVPTVFDAIENHKALSFRYRPRYKSMVREVLLHPYFLKEYNSRWFALGFASYKEGKAPNPYVCALDRIDGDITFADDVEYRLPKKQAMATDYFKDIVGVTRLDKPCQTIKIETQDEYTHWRIKTKKLHPSQQELKPYSDEGHGLFSIDVIPNNELDTLLLSFGAHIRILEPQSYVDSFQEMVRKLNILYFSEEKTKEKEDEKS